MDKKKLLATLIAATVATPAVHAMSDKEVEARFQKYEAQIKALQSEVKDLKSNGGVVYVQDLEKQNKRNAKQIDDIKAKMDSDAEKFKMNGFMTAAVSKSDNKLGTYELDDTTNFAGDAKMGLQFNYKMDEKVDATVQLIGRSRGQGLGNSSSSWQTSAEWAYIGYKMTDDLKLRMGRLRVPFYMYSETLDVGYSYPWVRPPTEMYTTAITSFNGADALYKFNAGPTNNTLQLFAGGSSNTDHADGSQDIKTDVALQDVYGINLTSNWGSWTARAMIATLSIDGTIDVRSGSVLATTDSAYSAIPAPAPLPGTLDMYIPALSDPAAAVLALTGFDSCDTDAAGAYCTPGGYLHKSGSDTFDYYALGAQYDDGSLFMISEVAQLDTKRAALFSDSVAAYVTGGYRINQWTPYATYAMTYDDEKSSVLAANNAVPVARKSVSLGLRRELSNSLSAKLQWDHFYDMENHGGFSDEDSPGDESNAYTFALDAVF